MVRDPRGKEQTDGVLAGHYKHGRSYRPALLAYEATALNDWFSDDLPDLLWPLMLVGRDGHEGAAALGKLQESVVDLFDDGTIERDGVLLDGRLTSLEICPASARPHILALLEGEEARRSTLPPSVIGLLRAYDDVPGAWLLVEPWADLPGIPDLDASAAALAEAMRGVLSDRHRNALTKSVVLGWQIYTRVIQFVGDTGDALINYPRDESKRSEGDAFVLTSFLSAKTFRAHSHPQLPEQSMRWAADFWNQNWSLFPCSVEDDRADADTRHDPSGSDEPEPDMLRTPDDNQSANAVDERLEAIVELALSAIDDRYDTFLRIASDRSRPINLHQPARHEVTCGLVARTYRAAIAILRAPHFWTGEHASPTQRLFTETEIVMRWLIARGDEAFVRYQDYGRGRRKLMRRHAEALAQQFGDDVPELLQNLRDRLEEQTGGTFQEEFQEVSLDATFAGISLREMAEEVGELDQYRHVMQPASGVLHSEWWALEDYAMKRCFQVLHRGHWIPVDTPEGNPTPQFSQLMVERFAAIVDLAEPALR